MNTQNLNDSNYAEHVRISKMLNAVAITLTIPVILALFSLLLYLGA